jgi:DNA gyrase subunit B
MQEKNVQTQFGLRAESFNQSAQWIHDQDLINAHVELGGEVKGVKYGLELCCGTGIVGKAFVERGWNMNGVDVTKEMVQQANQFYPAIQGNSEDLIFEDSTFDLVVIRQALFLLNEEIFLKEVKRVLKEEGSFIISQTIPFSSSDEAWLKKIHLFKQKQMLKFYTREDIENKLIDNGFIINEEKTLRVRESITNWMNYAPEQDSKEKEGVCQLIKESPEEYRKTRNVEEINGELYEDWNWIIFKSHKKV